MITRHRDCRGVTFSVRPAGGHRAKVTANPGPTVALRKDDLDSCSPGPARLTQAGRLTGPALRQAQAGTLQTFQLEQSRSR
eukprot:1616002-Rhodomonas_salina.1